MLHRKGMIYLVLVGVLISVVVRVPGAVRAVDNRTMTPTVNATAANGALTPIVDTATGNFAWVSDPYINDNDEIVFLGAQAGWEGVYHYQLGSITRVLQVSDVLTNVIDINTGLPINLGTVEDIWGYNLDEQGRVFVHVAIASAGSALLRWEDGTLTKMKDPDPGFRYSLGAFSADGTWLMTKTEYLSESERVIMRATNGVTSTPLLDMILDSDTGEPFDCYWEELLFTELNRGRLVYTVHETRYTATDTGGCSNPLTIDSQLKSAGTLSATLVTEHYSRNIHHDESGAEVAYARVNDSGDVAYQRWVSIGDDYYELFLLPGAAPLFTFNGAEYLAGTIAVNNERRAVIATTTSGHIADSLWVASSLGRELMLDGNAPLLGHNTWYLFANEARANSRLNTVFHYDYSDALGSGGDGIALLTKSVSRWINPAGGSWSTAANWLPAEAPGNAAETQFDLEATYEVTVGARQSGRSSVTNGRVSFRQADLDLLGPLAIGKEATLTIPEGHLRVGEIIVGALPPDNAAQPQLAKLNILNAGTWVTNTGSLKVGHAGEGEVFISSGTMLNAEVLIGAGSAGTLTAGGLNTLFSTGNLAVGYRYTGTLNIERDARVFSSEVVIGQGIAVENHLATVNLDASSSTVDTSWTISDTLTLGNQLPAELTISHGGNLGALGLMQAGLKAHPSRGSLFDALLTIEGTGTLSTTPSALYAFNDMLLGLDSGVRVSASILKGGVLNISGNLSVGHETGSNATMTVAGLNSNGARSMIDVGTDLGPEQCNIGFKGNGGLLVREGGRLECSQMRIGVLSDSTGYVLVSGEEQEVPSTFITHGLLCLGSGTACDDSSETNVHGTLELDESAHIIIGRGTVIGNGGRIIGRGEIAPGALGLGVFDGGSIDPGISQGLNPRSIASIPHSPVMTIPGQLIISGSLTFSPTASLVLDVIGKNGGQYDQLVINDSTRLDGRLELRFGNGFAPQQGDVFLFIQSATSSGTFGEVAITGLAPGFEYTVNAVDGTVTLTALNDGVPTTQTEHVVYLPLSMR